MPTYGTAGYAGKHALFSDPLLSWNSAFSKRWPFGENRNVEFRGEFFNFPNLTTFAPPHSLINDSNFGVVNTTRQNGRQIWLQWSMIQTIGPATFARIISGKN